MLSGSFASLRMTTNDVIPRRKPRNPDAFSNMKNYYVYIMTNERNRVLYTGVTNNIGRRVEEHNSSENASSFTIKYNVTKLVYLEESSNVEDAIAREKQIKGWTRKKKIELINTTNPEWDDLLNEHG